MSSQALKYDRVDGITFDVGVFLNISEDHISPIEHPDFNDYLKQSCGYSHRQKPPASIWILMRSADYGGCEKCRERGHFWNKAGGGYPGLRIRKDGMDTIFHVACDRFDQEFILERCQDCLMWKMLWQPLPLPMFWIYLWNTCIPD